MGRMRVVVLAALVGAAVAGGPSSVTVGGQSTPPPILLVVDDASANPFGGYLAEILRAEGLNGFATAPLSTLTAPVLATHRLAILAETTLSPAQAAMFADYVAGGGRLIAMRPDPQLFGTLGLGDGGGETTDGYLLIDQGGPGAGLQSMTLPFKGAAAHYVPTGTTSAIASLYETATTATAFPAVVMGQRTAAWSFDLARSVVYVRQGDPAFAGMERDGEPVYRTNDLFYGAIDLDRVGVPHADVQMRLFSRVIAALLADSTPLPQLWYFPGTARTVLVPTGDSHTSTLEAHTELLASAESVGARVSLYLARWLSLAAEIVDEWRAAGHEVSLHPYFSPDGHENDLPGGYGVATDWWQTNFPFTWGATTRHHALEWTGWVSPASAMASRGIRMDLSYYAWGPVMNHPTQQEQAHGYVNGSGLPMRFVTESGQILPVYQQVTALTDEQLVYGYYAQNLSVPVALAVSRQMIDNSQAGGYSAIAAQFHVDTYRFGEVGPWVDGTLQYAQSQQVPMWTAERWLQFVEARAATAVTNVHWSAEERTLTFTAALPEGAEPVTVLVPGVFAGETVTAVAVDGQSVTAPTFAVNGRSMRAVALTRPANGTPRSVAVFYAPTTPALTVGDVSVTEGHAGATVVEVPVTLSAPSASTVTVHYATNDGTATQGADYTATSGTVTFAPFEISATIAVSITGDVAVEGPETFSITLDSPENATIADGVGVVTIVDDDALPVVSIADASVTEGNSGTAPATFLVTLSQPSGVVVTVQYATANGTAVAPGDYIAGSGTLTFAPGVTSQPIAVSVVGDTTPEPNETFVVSLSGAVNATLGDAQALGTIINDDAGAATTATFQIQDGDDDVNEEGASFTADGGSVWVGSGASAATSFAGLRFTNVAIPPGAVVQSARLELRAASPQWLTTSYEFAVEAAANAAPFSSASRPSQRPLLAPRVTHTSNVQWLADTWYLLDEIAPLVQAAVNQPGWASGNALSLVVRGAGQNWARKFAASFEADPASAPRLVVTYASGAALPTLSVADVTVTEGTGTVVPATFAVTLSAPASETVTVQYAVVAGSATVGTDVAASSGTLTFAPGVTEQTVTVDVLGDALDEPTETFTLVLSAPVNATLADGTAQGTILDDDAAPAVSIADVVVAEGNAGTTPATFTVTLSAPSGQTVSVQYATAAGTAAAGADFTATSGTLTFAAGVTSQTVTVGVIGDTLDEADETFTVTLSNPVNVTIADGQGVATIADDDLPPSLSIGDVTMPEGQSGPGTAVFTVTLSAPSGRDISVAYATADGSAVAPGDYTAAAGTLTIPAGATSRTIAVTVLGDTVIEADETFTVTLSNPVNATIADGQGQATLVNDDGVPALAIADATVTEGQSGAVTMSFAVTLSAPSPQTVTVNYATANGTATAGSDYTAASGTLSFAPGVTSRTVDVTVAGDTLFEAAETFTVTLSTPVNATIADGSAIGTIANDDAAPVVTVGDVTVAEGNSSTTAAAFTVTLSAASGLPASVSYATANGTATAGSDFVAASGTLTIPAGATTGTVTVTVTGDVVFEPTETFTLVLSNPTNATIGDGTGVGTITNDDPQPTIAVGDASVTEGNTGSTAATFAVTLSGPSSQVITVQAATANGTALAGSDYTAVSVTVTFAPGVVSQAVPVSVLGDTAVEGPETFTLQLSAPVNATIADGTGVGTIVDDDVPALSINDVTVAEGNNGTSTASFTVSLSAISPLTVTVNYATANGTATAGSDYLAASGTLTFAPGTLTQTVNVTINGDTTTEPNETFVVNLTAPSNAILADAQGVGTITNDDAGPVTVTATFQIAAGVDDVTEDGGALTADSGEAWVGNGSSATASFAGFRFTGVTIPAGAIITSARLEVRAAGTQWQRMAFEFGIDAAANSPAFTAASRPSQRTLLAPRVTHSSDAQWLADTWYQLEQIAPLLQAAVDQPGWTPGNAVSLVLRGTGFAWGRKFLRAFEFDPQLAPRLVVTYQLAP